MYILLFPWIKTFIKISYMLAEALLETLGITGNDKFPILHAIGCAISFAPTSKQAKTVSDTETY
jgi:hypothetical protein